MDAPIEASGGLPNSETKMAVTVRAPSPAVQRDHRKTQYMHSASGDGCCAGHCAGCGGEHARRRHRGDSQHSYPAQCGADARHRRRCAGQARRVDATPVASRPATLAFAAVTADVAGKVAGPIGDALIRPVAAALRASRPSSFRPSYRLDIRDPTPLILCSGPRSRRHASCLATSNTVPSARFSWGPTYLLQNGQFKS
jgi:hypothetical protein